MCAIHESFLSHATMSCSLGHVLPHQIQNPKVNPLLTLTASKSLTHLKKVHAQIIPRSNFNSHSHSLPYPDTHFSNKLLRQFSRGPKPENTLLLYKKLRRDGSTLDRFSFPPLLKAVAKVSALNEGLEIHGLASKLGFHADPFIQTGLIGMYAACGRIIDARLLFDKMSNRDVVTWNIMIDGYAIIFIMSILLLC